MKSLREYILDSLRKTELFEQAFNREQVIRQIMNLSRQIIENWALILYVREYDKENLNLKHWKSELTSHCDNIYDMNIKSGDKTKAIRQALVRDYEYNNSDNVYRLLKKKFEKEHISDTQRRYIATQISQNIEELVNALGNKYGADDWIEKL